MYFRHPGHGLRQEDSIVDEDSPQIELVTLRYRLRDNISGAHDTAISLRDPQGIGHFFWDTAPDRSQLFPSGDPSQWADRTFTVLRPAGSAPGTWGLAEMTVRDRAGNFKAYDFTEIIHFDVADQ